MTADPRDELLRDAARVMAFDSEGKQWLSRYAALQTAPRVPCRWSGVEDERFRDHGCPAGHCGYCAVDQAAPRADAVAVALEIARECWDHWKLYRRDEEEPKADDWIVKRIANAIARRGAAPTVREDSTAPAGEVKR